MNNFNFNSENDSALVMTVSKAMRQVYLKMFLALLVSGITALFCATTPYVWNLLFAFPFMTFGLVIAEFALVLLISARLHKMSETTATLLFYVYAILTGITLSVVLLIYTEASVLSTFMITGGVFAAMSIYGYVTKNDLTRFGSFMFMGLIGLIILSVVNFFMKSSQMEWIISLMGVAIFIGLTAWDTQKIKRMVEYSTYDSVGKIATFGALTLYLDFINLFLYLLRFFGNRR